MSGPLASTVLFWAAVGRAAIVHKKSIVISLDEEGNILGTDIIAAKSDDESESVHDIAEAAENKTESVASQIEDVIDELNVPQPITVNDPAIVDEASDVKIDPPTAANDPEIPPIPAVSEPERIEPLDVPKPAERPKYRHRWGWRH